MAGDRDAAELATGLQRIPLTLEVAVLFRPEDVAECLQTLLDRFDTQVFAQAPPRPTSLVQETPTHSGDATTSAGLPLVGAAFKSAPIHIPNAGAGDNARHSYKSELILTRDPNVGTKKLLWWHDKDPRKDPHDHPWDFRSAILYGGYTEERFWIDDHGKICKEVSTYKAGDVNLMPANVFHNVISVEPGTVTFLDCGPARPGNAWSYLDVEKGIVLPFNELTPANFLTLFREMNTHLQPKRG